MAVSQYQVDSCVRGYHQYQAIWTSAVGETLPCVREPTNTIDRYAVAVVRSGVVVGHLPKKISRVCSIFLRREGTIHCTVINTRRYSADLPQGGLEIPCTLHFEGKKKEVNSLERHLRKSMPNS